MLRFCARRLGGHGHGHHGVPPPLYKPNPKYDNDRRLNDLRAKYDSEAGAGVDVSQNWLVFGVLIGVYTTISLYRYFYQWAIPTKPVEVKWVTVPPEYRKEWEARKAAAAAGHGHGHGHHDDGHHDDGHHGHGGKDKHAVAHH